MLEGDLLDCMVYSIFGYLQCLSTGFHGGDCTTDQYRATDEELGLVYDITAVCLHTSCSGM